MASLTRWCFLTDFYDAMAGIVRQYQLYFYPDDNSIELHDVKNKKVFLKRVITSDITKKDLFVGSDITIYSRKLKIVEYGDGYTKKLLDENRATTFGMIKPDSYLNIGKIIDMLYNQGGFSISKLKMTRLSLENASEFYAEHRGKPFYENLVNFMSSDLSVGMELVKKDAIKEYRSFIGPTNSNTAREQQPGSIRAIFGTDGSKNCVHGADSNNSAERETNFFMARLYSASPFCLSLALETTISC